MADEPQIRRLLEQIAETLCTPETACREHPELLEQVRQRWREMRALAVEVEAMFPHSGPPESRARKRSFDLAGAGAALPQIPGYRVECLIGRGGMGVVYKARHLLLDRPVAIKMLLLGSLSTPHELACLLREAQAVAGLHHPHIVQVHDVGDFDGLPYFTMEFVEGGNLAQKLGGLPLPARDAAALAATLADAVEAAHRGGVVHRDLKPANILMSADGEPKIADFSLARRLEVNDTLSLNGAAIGTPSYMAPEQTVGHSAAFNPAVDIYALGAVLYELLTGRPPFRADSPAETQRQVLAEDPAPPSRLNSRVPRDLETICLKCLQKDPARRYPSAAALAADLRRFLNGEPISARPSGVAERTAKWVRRRPAQTLAIGVGTLLLLSVLGAALWLGAQRAALTRAVEADLQEISRCQAATDWAAASAALDRAKTRIGGQELGDLRKRIDRASADLKLVEQLQAVRMDRALANTADFNRVKADGAYTDLFRDAGLILDDEPVPQSAQRIAASPIRGSLVNALDDWAFCMTDRGRLQRILAIAKRADPDPEWRDRVRDFRRWENLAELSELAATARVADESVSLQLMLAGLIDGAKGDSASFVRRVQEAHPSDFWANIVLAQLMDERDNIDAIGYYRAAIAIRPNAVAALVNLGNALAQRGRLAESIDYLSRAAGIAPDSPVVNFNLAIALFNAEQNERAAEFCRRAIQFDPDHFRAQSLLASCLIRMGRFAEADSILTYVLQRLPGNDQLRPTAQTLLDTCRRRSALAARLPALLAGEQEPANAEESIEVGGLLLCRRHYAAAARFFSRAFDASPELTENLSLGYRYNAACAAANAGSRGDVDQGTVDEATRSRMRSQSLRWLQADLAAWTRIQQDPQSPLRQFVIRSLAHWRTDADLAAVRDRSSLDSMTPSEQDQWTALWKSVDALLASAAGPP